MQTLTTEEREKLVSYLPEEFRSAALLDAWIDGALLTVGRQYFKGAFIYALSLVVCHKAALANRGVGGEAGAVSSVREGDVSVSYAAPAASGNDAYFSSTSYGLEFLQLKRQYSARPGITGSFRLGGKPFGHLA